MLLEAINQVAKVFSYNRGNIPALEPSTDFVALQKLKSTLDTYVQMKRDDEPAQNARAKAARGNKTRRREGRCRRFA